MSECGLSFNTPNAKIIGGSTAVAHSWPSIAFVVFFFEGIFFLRDYNLYVTKKFYSVCGGTLIDRRTILIAAHCIVEEVEFTYKNITYFRKVYTNSDYPTFASMYTVYLGLQDFSDDWYKSPVVEMSVIQIIQVI